jgi:hypothetical protein
MFLYLALEAALRMPLCAWVVKVVASIQYRDLYTVARWTFGASRFALMQLRFAFM